MGANGFRNFQAKLPENLKTAEFPKCVHAPAKSNEIEISEKKYSKFPGTTS